jgi:hypothetical protein
VESDLTPEDNEDLDYLHSLDPKEWKQQDHYAVLGDFRDQADAEWIVIRRR